MAQVKPINPSSLSKAITELADQFGLVLVVQFGSSIDSQAILHPESDIDLALLGKQRLPLTTLAPLVSELAQIFQVMEDTIDIVDLMQANSLLNYHVATKGRVLYDSGGHQFNEFYLKAMKQYLDEAPLFEFESQALHERVKRKGH